MKESLLPTLTSNAHDHERHSDACDYLTLTFDLKQITVRQSQSSSSVTTRFTGSLRDSIRAGDAENSKTRRDKGSRSEIIHAGLVGNTLTLAYGPRERQLLFVFSFLLLLVTMLEVVFLALSFKTHALSFDRRNQCFHNDALPGWLWAVAGVNFSFGFLALSTLLVLTVRACGGIRSLFAFYVYYRRCNVMESFLLLCLAVVMVLLVITDQTANGSIGFVVMLCGPTMPLAIDLATLIPDSRGFLVVHVAVLAFLLFFVLPESMLIRFRCSPADATFLFSFTYDSFVYVLTILFAMYIRAFAARVRRSWAPATIKLYAPAFLSFNDEGMRTTEGAAMAASIDDSRTYQPPLGMNDTSRGLLSTSSLSREMDLTKVDTVDAKRWSYRPEFLRMTLDPNKMNVVHFNDQGCSDGTTGAAASVIRQRCPGTFLGGRGHALTIRIIGGARAHFAIRVVATLLLLSGIVGFIRMVALSSSGSLVISTSIENGACFTLDDTGNGNSFIITLLFVGTGSLLLAGLGIVGVLVVLTGGGSHLWTYVRFARKRNTMESLLAVVLLLCTLIFCIGGRNSIIANIVPITGSLIVPFGPILFDLAFCVCPSRFVAASCVGFFLFQMVPMMMIDKYSCLDLDPGGSMSVMAYAQHFARELAFSSLVVMTTDYLRSVIRKLRYPWAPLFISLRDAVHLKRPGDDTELLS